MRFYTIIMGLLFCFIPYWLKAQSTSEGDISEKDSALKVNRLDTKSNHSGNTYIWNGKIVYYLKDDLYNLSINEQYNSTVIKSNQKYIQDIQDLDLSFSVKIFDNFHYKLSGNSTIFADDRSIGIKNASIHSFLNGVTYFPLNQLSVSALIGWKFDNQIGIKDDGLSYLLNSSYSDIVWDDYKTDINFNYLGDLLDPRKNLDRKILMSINKSFSENAVNTLSIFYRDFRKDFYIPMDSVSAKYFNSQNNIESREENILLFNNELSYIFEKYLSFVLNTNIYYRDILKTLRYRTASLVMGNPFDLRVNELKLEGLLQIKTDFGFMKNIMRIGINERDEKHSLDYFEGMSNVFYQSKLKSETAKDNIAKSTFISLNNYFKLSENDDLSVSGLISILRYDTPSELNYDDRDELQGSINISENHIFNEFLSLKTNLDLSSIHNVFIFSERSANNYVNKIIRLYAQTDYQPANFLKTSNLFEVLANYTIYDFEDLAPAYKSLIFRQFGWIDSSAVNITDKLGLGFFSYIKFYERGELKWEEFKELPVEFINDNSYHIQLKYSTPFGMIFAVGYKMFIQNRYKYKNLNKELYLTQKSEGPTFNINISFKDYFALGCEGWYEKFYQGGVLLRTIANFNLNLSWYY